MTDNAVALAEAAKTLQSSIATLNKLTRRGVEVELMLKDLVFHEQNRAAIAAHPNPFTRFGRKCFSQNDEDGLTLEIVKRLGLTSGVYAEFGVGDGLENNTLILAALGWKGFWVGGSDLAFSHAQAQRFKYIKDWITLENIVGHCRDRHGDQLRAERTRHRVGAGRLSGFSQSRCRNAVERGDRTPATRQNRSGNTRNRGTDPRDR